MKRHYVESGHEWLREMGKSGFKGATSDKRYVQILKYIGDHDGCTKIDVLKGIGSNNFGRGQYSDIFSALKIAGLIEYDRENNEYHITDEGNDVLENSYLNDMERIVTGRKKFESSYSETEMKDKGKEVFTIQIERMDEYGEYEVVDEMKYAKTYYSFDDAVEDGKKAYDEYSATEDTPISVCIMGGEYEMPNGDIYGEPEGLEIIRAENRDKFDESTQRKTKMKKLNITKEQFNRSNYFQRKYGKLEYVSESGRLFKTNKGKVLMFNESVDEPKYSIGDPVYIYNHEWIVEKAKFSERVGEFVYDLYTNDGSHTIGIPERYLSDTPSKPPRRPRNRKFNESEGSFFGIPGVVERHDMIIYKNCHIEPSEFWGNLGELYDDEHPEDTNHEGFDDWCWENSDLIESELEHLASYDDDYEGDPYYKESGKKFGKKFNESFADMGKQKFMSVLEDELGLTNEDEIEEWVEGIDQNWDLANDLMMKLLDGRQLDRTEQLQTAYFLADQLENHF